METYEKCKVARRVVLNTAAEVMAYRNWSNDFGYKQIAELPERLEGVSDIFGINPSDLTKEQMLDLGFGKWSKKDSMMLIPLWLFPFIADEFECSCIDGTKAVMKKSEMDNDHRFGVLAYGVLPKDEMRVLKKEVSDDALH